jgi:hypothetical protein
MNLENAEHRTSNIERRMLPLAAVQRQHSMFGVRRSMFDVSCSGSWRASICLGTCVGTMNPADRSADLQIGQCLWPTSTCRIGIRRSGSWRDSQATAPN